MARRTSAGLLTRTARVGLIVALNAAALAVLWRAWPREAEASAKAQPAASVEARAGAAATARLRTLGQGPLSSASGILRSVETGARSIVARWIESARELSKNKVHAGNAAVAVCVRELGAPASGEVDLGAGRSLTPASNMKLVTTAAALALLGPKWEFRTRVEGSGPIVQGVLQGDLVLRAAGDPLFDRERDGQIEHFLAPLCDALAAHGIERIAGDVVLDEGAFAAPAPAEQWPPPEQHWAEYCALAGGFSLNRGCVTTLVRPATAGALAQVEVLPRGHGLDERLGVRTVDAGKLTIHFGAKSGAVVVSGSIPARSEVWSESAAVPDPVEFFGQVVCATLAGRGIVLDGRLTRRRHAPGGPLLCELRTALHEYLAEINTDSTNAVADQVLLALGNEVIGQGSFPAGARATREALQALGVSAEGFEQLDGSGLSRGNRVSARQIVALLESVVRSDAGSARVYLDSLALSGSAGTLALRMKSGPAAGRVRAKTGFINGVSALSGFVERADGRTFVFSVLVNYPHVDGLNTNCWKHLQDELCELLASVNA